MKQKNISTQSGKLLAFFNELDQDSFTISQAEEALKVDGSRLRELLSDMTKRGLIMRIKDGIYHLIPYEENSESYIPDWHLIAKALVKDDQYYIGYYSALQVHNLITQPSLKEQIVVPKQMRSSEIIVKGIPFQFIYHNEDHFFGDKKIWIDDFNKVRCSDIEKTIVDCLFKPDYAGGIVEIAKAIYTTRQQLDFEKLLRYCIRFKSQAVVKRLGYLLELLEIDTKILWDLQGLKAGAYIVLDTGLPKTGTPNNRWSILQNLDTETIKSAIYT
jgi:predicted transcriptional regulator of viral defense system